MLLPLHPEIGHLGTVWTRVQDAIVLPAWHCTFQGCTATSAGWSVGSSHEGGLWDHIWGAHKEVMTRIIRKHKLNEPFLEIPEIAFTLYNQALAEKESYSCPRLGIATDRRAMLHLGEVFRESSIATIMCFICGCKHIMHQGFDKFGHPVPKGGISYRSNRREMLHKILTHSSYAFSWEHNLSYKRFKDRFGEAVAADPDLQHGIFEWKRKVQRSSGSEEAFCCPQDVRR